MPSCLEDTGAELSVSGQLKCHCDSQLEWVVGGGREVCAEKLMSGILAKIWLTMDPLDQWTIL